MVAIFAAQQLRRGVIADEMLLHRIEGQRPARAGGDIAEVALAALRIAGTAQASEAAPV